MNADSTPASLLSFSKRLPSFASIGLLAGAIFGLARLGFGVVPVWILAVPFVLLACMDLEGRFRQVGSVTAQAGLIAFHFVIVATVVAAHQQIGAARDGAVTAGVSDSHAVALKSIPSGGGCGSGGCGSSGSCGSLCGGGGGQGKSSCGCSSSTGTSMGATATAKTRTPVAGPLARSTLIDADGTPKHMPAPVAVSSTSRSPVFISSHPPGVTAGGSPPTTGPASTVTANPTSTPPSTPSSPTSRVPGVTNVPLPGLTPHGPPPAPSSGVKPATPPVQTLVPAPAAQSPTPTPPITKPE